MPPPMTAIFFVTGASGSGPPRVSDTRRALRAARPVFRPPETVTELGYRDVNRTPLGETRRCAGRRRARHARRDLVPGRDASRTEERLRPTVGGAWQPAAPAGRAALHQHIHARRRLPGARYRYGTRAALRRHLRRAAPHRRDRSAREPGRGRRDADGQRRLAPRGKAGVARQSAPGIHPGELPRARRAGQDLAIHAPDLLFQSRVRRLPDHRRRHLRCLADTPRRRPTHHLDRNPRLGRRPPPPQQNGRSSVMRVE